MSNRRRGAINIDSALVSTQIPRITAHCDGIDEMKHRVAANGCVLERIENQANIVLSRARIDDAESQYRLTLMLGGRDQSIAALQ